ncbi:S8 family serine peptidase [Gemmatimonadota bacterium]
MKRVMPSFSQADTFQVLNDGRIYKPQDYTNWYSVELPNELAVHDLVSNLNELPIVQNVTPDRPWVTFDGSPKRYQPDDTWFDLYQWNMWNRGYWGGTSGEDVNAKAAWDISTGNDEMIIGIIDTGIYGHSEFGNRVTPNTTWSHPHGTEVTGIAAAEGDNNAHIAGMDWEAEIYNGKATLSSSASIVSAITAAVSAGARVLNCSWGNTEWDENVRQALLDAFEADVLIVHAATPDYSAYHYTTNYGSFMLHVGGLDNDGEAASYQLENPFVDLAAPGGDDIRQDYKDQIRTTYVDPQIPLTWNFGTSLAAPHATGLASLMWGENSDLTSYDIEWIQKYTAVPIGSEYKKYGTGRLDAEEALLRSKSPYQFDRGNATWTRTHQNTQWYWATSPDGFRLDADPLPSGTYYVDRWELSFSSSDNYWGEPWAWLSMMGYSGASSNSPVSYDYQYMDGSVTWTQQELSTYFYYILEDDEETPINMWVPFDPTGIPKKYTITGKPLTPPSEIGELEGYYDSRQELVVLYWPSSSEYEHVDFYRIWRAEDGGEYERLGSTGPVSGPTVTYEDDEFYYPLPDYYTYKVQAHNAAGYGPYSNETQPIGIGGPEMASAKAVSSAPDSLTLENNYPNPFNPSTIIKYGLPFNTHVKLSILNTRGQTIRILIDESIQAGWHTTNWDGKDTSGREVSSGIYFYLVEANGKRLLGKMTLIREQCHYSHEFTRN